MSNSFMIVEKEDWEKMEAEQREWMTFNTLQSMHKRLVKLEKRPLVDKAISFGGGIVGGVAAVLGFKVGG